MGEAGVCGGRNFRLRSTWARGGDWRRSYSRTAARTRADLLRLPLSLRVEPGSAIEEGSSRRRHQILGGFHRFRIRLRLGALGARIEQECQVLASRNRRFLELRYQRKTLPLEGSILLRSGEGRAFEPAFFPW